MLTSDQLAAIKSRLQDWDNFICDGVFTKDIADLLADYERLTRHNQRMSAALAQLGDKENWGEYSIDYGGFTIEKSMWNGTIDPQQLAERALVEDS